MFNNTVNTRVKPDASFLVAFPLPHCSIMCNGHTLFSYTISRNYDDDDDYLPFSLSHLLLSLFLYRSFSPYSCSDDSVFPPRHLLFTLPCTIRFFLPVFLPGSYRIDSRHCNRLGEIHFLTTEKFLRQNLHHD